ncbi:energy transducer TonB [Novilysobacter antarcticus]|uniref:energy transducer TonB n=1 Tax=Novilysobacter antarcticus TaxID=2862543 RepID=UPI001C991627|nr:energy transducer TonB [Lysobacter antarcticus]
MNSVTPQARQSRRLLNLSRLSLVLALGLALGACGKDEPAADAAAPATKTDAAPPAATPETVVADTVQAMSVEELRDAARKAYSDNRLYAPAGNNAVEYYLSLREKSPADAGVSSALTDLLPMTVIAIEQSIAREDFTEAERLTALLERAEPQHPALARLHSSIESRKQAVAERAVQQQITAEQQATRQAELERQRLIDQKQQQEQAAKALQEKQAADAAAEAAAAEAAAQAEKRAQERRAAEAAKAAEPPPPPRPTRPTAADLRPLSTPAPNFPPDALRAGTSGEVQVEFTVGTDGSVTSARVVNSEPRRVFDRAAMDAVQRWRFQPISEPVTTRRTIAFTPGG